MGQKKIWKWKKSKEEIKLRATYIGSHRGRTVTISWKLIAEPFILGELRYITASGGWKKELSMVHGTLQIFFRNKTFLFVKIDSWNFQQLFDLGFHEALQSFSSFRQTFRWHFCMGDKDLSKLAEILWGFTK